MKLTGATRDILEERICQDKKWGEQNHSMPTWLVILMEEVGEFSREVYELKFDPELEPPFDKMTKFRREAIIGNIRCEAVQVAAVATAIVECIDRGKWLNEEEKRVGTDA